MFRDITALASASCTRLGKIIMLFASLRHKTSRLRNSDKSQDEQLKAANDKLAKPDCYCVQRKPKAAPDRALEDDKPVFVRVPASLDVDVLKAHYGKNTLGYEKHLAIIGRVTAKFAHTSRYEQDQMQPFSYDGFHYLAGNEASDILKLELGSRKDKSGKKFSHLQCDNHWRRNVKAMSYRPDPSMWGPTKSVEIKHARLAQRIRNMREDGQENPLDKRLRQQMKAVRFDAELARKLVEQQYQKDLKNPKLKAKAKTRRKHKKVKQGIKTLAVVDDMICDVVLWETEEPKAKRSKFKSPEESRDFALACIEDIEKNQWRWKQDAMGRRHHNYSNMPKYLRRCCLDESGKSLYEIDIKNSQPLIQATFFMQCGAGEYDDLDKRLKLANALVDMACSGDSETRLRQGPDYEYDKKGRVIVHSRKGLVRHFEDLIFKTAQIVRAHREEFEAYLTSAQSGLFYEEQGWRAKEAGDARMWYLLKTNRSAAKARFMAMWYGQNPRKGKESKAYKAYKAAWPHVAAVTSMWKALHFPIMAKLMQRLESDIMLGVVARGLSDLPMLITVHDSIMCRRQDVARVKAAIEQAWPYKPQLEMCEGAKRNSDRKAKKLKARNTPIADSDLYLASLPKRAIEKPTCHHPSQAPLLHRDAIRPRIARKEQQEQWTSCNSNCLITGNRPRSTSARPGARLLSRQIPLSRGPPLEALRHTAFTVMPWLMPWAGDSL